MSQDKRGHRPATETSASHADSDPQIQCKVESLKIDTAMAALPTPPPLHIYPLDIVANEVIFIRCVVAAAVAALHCMTFWL